MQQSDKRLQMRVVINRLRRWIAIDEFAAIQEPGLRDEYSARAAVTTLLCDAMEADLGISPQAAIRLMEDRRLLALSAPTVSPTSDPPSRYHEQPNSREDLFPHAAPERSSRVTIPAKPASKPPALKSVPDLPDPGKLK